jgi:hypothetical protein
VVVLLNQILLDFALFVVAQCVNTDINIFLAVLLHVWTLVWDLPSSDIWCRTISCTKLQHERTIVPFCCWCYYPLSCSRVESELSVAAITRPRLHKGKMSMARCCSQRYCKVNKIVFTVLSYTRFAIRNKNQIKWRDHISVSLSWRIVDHEFCGEFLSACVCLLCSIFVVIIG